MQGQAIRFSPCGVTSWNPTDVAEAYCGLCHSFVARTPRPHPTPPENR
jgi:hypothetical protein